MKKYLIALAALCGFAIQANAADTDLTALNNVVYIAPATLTQGQTQTIALNAKNKDNLRAFQCEVVLPEGITFKSFAVAGERSDGKNFGLSGANFSDGVVKVLFGGNSEDVIVPGDGQIALITVEISASLAVGSYPIRVQNTVLNGLDTEADIVESTLTVSDRITLDEDATEAPADAEGAKVKVLRTIKANEWSTICLPFAMTEAQVAEAFGAGVQLADFTGYETIEDEEITGIKVSFETAKAIEANHPYIIKVAADVASFNVDGVNIAAEEEPKNAVIKRTKKAWSEFIGNYVAGTEVPENTLFLNGGKFYYSKGNNTIKAFRGYFDFYDVLTEVEGEVKAFINIDGMANGVVELQNNVKANGAIFNLAGQRVSKAQKGIFIQNGKKTVIK